MPSRERVLVRRVGELSSAVGEVLDFLDWDFCGQRVWVKPNLLAPHPPERSVTTDPDLVRTVVHQLRARGAREIIVGDNPGGSLHGRVEDFLRATEVVRASEGCFRNIAQSVAVLKLDSRFVSEVPVSAVLNQVDVILNLPVFKTHALTLLTGAVKNLYGVIVGGQKTALHTRARSPDDFAELLVDCYQAIKVPTLHIMDALRGMDGQMGPSAGRVLKIGKLLAARNGVALDSVMALMAGIQPAEIPLLRIAGARGLGPITAEAIEIAGDFEVIPGFQLPTRHFLGAIAGIAGLIYPWLQRYPILVRDRCVYCKRCAENCPAQAMKLAPDPTVDRQRCILCYCCVEICPEQALRIPGQYEGIVDNLIARLGFRR